MIAVRRSLRHGHDTSACRFHEDPSCCLHASLCRSGLNSRLPLLLAIPRTYILMDGAVAVVRHAHVHGLEVEELRIVCSGTGDMDVTLSYKIVRRRAVGGGDV